MLKLSTLSGISIAKIWFDVIITLLSGIRFPISGPPVVSIAQSSYSVNIGNSITLFCTVSATPPEFNVYWTRAITNQQEEVISTTNSGKYSGSTVSSPSLVIFNTDLNDIALYRCHAENSVGIGQSNTTTLTVVGSKLMVVWQFSGCELKYVIHQDPITKMSSSGSITYK